jgi:HNH endonuclease
MCSAIGANLQRGMNFLLRDTESIILVTPVAPDDDRVIPSWVKFKVWKRDRGRCSYPSCGATSGLHFDHVIPHSKGGSSKDPANIQILCGRHNLAKHDKIE